MKRVLIILTAVLVGLALILSLALWAFLASWVPVHGKARLIQELERRGTIRVAIDSIRYDLLRGFTLTAIEVTDRATRERLGAVSLMQLHVSPVAYVLGQRLVFRGRAGLQHPAETLLTFSGRYGLRDETLALDLQTTDIDLSALSARLRDRLPPSLEDGRVRADLHLERSPHTRPRLRGVVTGSELLWSTAPWRLRGDLVVDGAAIAPSPDGSSWAIEADVRLSRAALEGLAVIGTVDRLEGTAQITQGGHVHIRTLTGRTLGSSWSAEGFVRVDRHAAFEVFVRSHAELAPLVELIPQLAGTWQAKGAGDLEAVCRGVVPSSPIVLDCLTRATLSGIALSGGRLARPLTAITGRVDYDFITRRLSSDRLTGSLGGEPFALAGAVTLRAPVTLDLALTGRLPLEMTRPWLPAAWPIERLEGSAALDLTLRGGVPDVQPSGEIAIRDATLKVAKPAMACERINVTARLSPERLEIRDATLIVNEQPLRLQVLVTPPRVEAAVHFSHGRCEIAGQLTPKEFLIDQGILTLTNSELRFQGAWARTDERPSSLVLSGLVELGELDEVPFLDLTRLRTWNLQGLTQVDAEFEGRMSDWRGARLRARLRADRLGVRDVPLEQPVCLIEQQAGMLRLQVPSALIAEGKFWGELTLEHREAASDYVLQADLLGLRLERLRQLIPAWREREISGTASTHALLSGTTNARPSWRGEGWLNASGERLGDMPLLDTVFRGLFGMLADRLGLETLRRAQITQASLQWRLAEERIVTDDLRLGGMAGPEPVALYARGSVGLDQTLDFVIEPELSEGALLQAPTTSSLAQTILKAAGQLERLRRLVGRHRLTGTLKNPDYRFEFSTQEILKQFAPAPVDLLNSLFDAVR